MRFYTQPTQHHPANQPIHNSTTPTRPPHLSSFFVREHEPRAHGAARAASARRPRIGGTQGGEAVVARKPAARAAGAARGARCGGAQGGKSNCGAQGAGSWWAKEAAAASCNTREAAARASWSGGGPASSVGLGAGTL